MVFGLSGFEIAGMYIGVVLALAVAIFLVVLAVKKARGGQVRLGLLPKKTPHLKFVSRLRQLANWGFVGL